MGRRELADIWTHQLARVAKAVNDQLATLVRDFGRSLSGSRGVEGIQLVVRLVPLASSAAAAPKRDSGPGSGELVHWYVPLDVIARFASDEISSQRVMDQFLMIQNGNRVELSLATWQKD